MNGASFDQAAFAAAITAAISARRLTDRHAAAQAGISPSTLTRLRQGHNPDVDTLAVLADWAQLPVDAFIVRTTDIATPLVDDVRRTVAALRASEAAVAALRLIVGDQRNQGWEEAR